MIEVRQTTEFAEWLASLRDVRAQARVGARIRQAELGNLGDVQPCGGGVIELRIHYGPGYRLYAVRRGDELIILLCGGDKSSQKRDIKTAKTMAEEV